MDSKLNNRTIKISECGNNKKKRRCKRSWWLDNLTLLLNDMCKAESEWLESDHQNKKKYLERRHWYRVQDELINVENGDQKEFWRRIGKKGVGNDRQNIILMEVKLEDGT